MVVIAYMRVLHTKRAVLLRVLFNILTIKMLIMNSVISQTILVQCMTINRITDQYDVGFEISKYNLQMCTRCFTIQGVAKKVSPYRFVGIFSPTA